MYLESLPNELLLYLFEYLNGIDILRAFHDLNSRFNNLLYIHHRTYHLNFRLISKSDFDTLCQSSLPFIFDRILSLIISNDDQTPNLPDIFLSYNLTLDKFIYLQSLSLYSIKSFNQLNQLIYQCHQLLYLTHLSIVDNNKYDRENDIGFLMNYIWSLPKIYYFYLNYHSFNGVCLTKISTVSPSMKKLSIENIPCTLHDLLYLLKYTPALEHLSIYIQFNLSDEHIPIRISSIISLNLTFESSLPVLINIFRMMPNLKSLILKTIDIYLTGDKWKNIHIKYLSQLKIFHMRMYFEFSSNERIDEQLQQLITSYQTSFWIKKQKWFIQCDCIQFGNYYHGILYTLPYAFDTFFPYSTLQSKFTCPSDRNYWLCKRVHHLEFKTNKLDDSILLPIQCPNIQYLTIPIPFHGNFLSYISSFNQLTTLAVTLSDNYTMDQLQTLINTLPCLYSLKISYSVDLTTMLKQIHCRSIRYLNLITECSLDLTYFDDSRCTTLVNSQLGHRCEVLLIKVNDRRNILYLIEKMNSLRALIVQCKDDKWNKRRVSSSIDDLLRWLRHRLPRTCSIIRSENEQSNIRIWINRNEKQNLSNGKTMEKNESILYLQS